MISHIARTMRFVAMLHICYAVFSNGLLPYQRKSSNLRSIVCLATAKWEVYVDQSKVALEKGAGATLDAFLGLAPTMDVKVIPAILTTKMKSKAPSVRCISLGSKSSFDVGNVDSVDKVFRILNKHMQVKSISLKTCECLKWKYKGNGYLEAGKISNAIEAYDNAIATNTPEQEGIVLLMRANAYMQRANLHREKLRDIVHQLSGMMPDTDILHTMLDEFRTEPALTNSLVRRILTDTAQQEAIFRQTQYRHGLYQYALLQAAQDSLRSTQLLPTYADAWRLAGDILSALWKLKDSAQYYVHAIDLDNSLSEYLLPVIKRLQKRQTLLDNARVYGWSEDTLRLALDVAR